MIDMNLQRLSYEIDATLTHTELYKSVMVSAHTPEILQQVGLEDLPILMSQNHVRNCLSPKDITNPQFHGLTKNNLLQMPSFLNHPAILLDSLTDDQSIVIVSDSVDDDDGLPIIAAIRSYGEGQYQLSTVQSNYLTSTYGRNNFDKFLHHALELNKVLYVDKKRTQSLERCSQLRLLKAYTTNFEFNKIIRLSDNVSQGKAAYYNNFLHKSLVVEAPSHTRKADQFVVGVDLQQDRFVVFSQKNPVAYKLFSIPFDYLTHLNTYDGDGNRLRLVTPRPGSVANRLDDLSKHLSYQLPSKLNLNHPYYQAYPQALQEKLNEQLDLIAHIQPSDQADKTFLVTVNSYFYVSSKKQRQRLAQIITQPLTLRATQNHLIKPPTPQIRA